MLSLPAHNWYRLFVWMALGLVIYFCYGYWNSRIGRGLPPRASGSARRPNARATGLRRPATAARPLIVPWDFPGRTFADFRFFAVVSSPSEIRTWGGAGRGLALGRPAACRPMAWFGGRGV